MGGSICCVAERKVRLRIKENLANGKHPDTEYTAAAIPLGFMGVLLRITAT
jgi:hypothetical protein